MSKRFLMSVLLLMVLSVAVLSGCNSTKPPKEALSSAAVQALKMDSYVLKNQVKILDFSVDAASAENPEVGSMLSMLKNAEINIQQTYQKDPMQTEAKFEIKLAGDVATTITIPFVMTKEKIYVKIPSIPFLPMPENVVGKFLVLDMKELAEKNGQEFSADLFDTEKTQKLSAELTAAIFGAYDTEKYFKNIEPKDASLPEGYKAKQVVQFYITNDTVKDAATTFVNKVLPDLLDIIGKEEYRSMLQVKPEDIADMKKELKEGNQDELGKALDDMKKNLKINQFTANTAIDEKNYPSYQDINANVEVNDPETNGKVKLSMQVKSQFSKINEKQTFEIGIPKDTITLEDLQKEMGSYGY